MAGYVRIPTVHNVMRIRSVVEEPPRSPKIMYLSVLLVFEYTSSAPSLPVRRGPSLIDTDEARVVMSSNRMQSLNQQLYRWEKDLRIALTSEWALSVRIKFGSQLFHE